MKSKKCSKCGRIKPFTKFYKRKDKKDGRTSWCKTCRTFYYRINRKKKEYSKRYNLTLEDYDRMFQQQNGVCYLCGGINFDGKRLAFDHNHKTGKIRKLLCQRCNLLLGRVEKDPSLIRKMLKYLDEK